MSNVSSNSPIENIGALELNRASVLSSDNALEATAFHASPTLNALVPGCMPTVNGSCIAYDDGALETVAMGPNMTVITYCGCGRIDDDALENAAVTITAGPTIAPCTVMTCPRIDDGALEASAGPVTPTGGAWTQFCCRRIDDGALEAVAVTGPAQTQTIITYCFCPRVDDGELEAAIAAPVPTTVHTGCYHIRVDDRALEATAGILHANPTGAGNICNMSAPLMCPRRIDDGVN